MRIVDPVGLSMAWLSAVHAGAIIALDVRDRVGDPWQALIRASPSMPAACLTTMIDGQVVPLSSVGSPWKMLRRDPTTGIFGCTMEGFQVSGWCEAGDVRMTVDAPRYALERLELVIDPDSSTLLREVATEMSIHDGTMDVRVRKRSGGDHRDS